METHATVFMCNRVHVQPYPPCHPSTIYAEVYKMCYL
jgi:hypothetical protein